MTLYPAGVYSPRTKKNKPGVVYDPARETLGFVEDITKLDDEVIAVETELGTNPKWSSASIKERLKGIRSLADAVEDIITIKGGNVGIGTTNPSFDLDVRGHVTFGYNSSNTENTIEFEPSVAGGVGKIYSSYWVTEGDLVLGTYSHMGDQLYLKSNGNVGIGTTGPNTKLEVAGAITQSELSADPTDPAEGKNVKWQSDGTGSGDDGDIMMKITAGGATKIVTLVDFSTL